MRSRPFWSNAVFSPIRSKLSWHSRPAIGRESRNKSPPASSSSGNSPSRALHASPVAQEASKIHRLARRRPNEDGYLPDSVTPAPSDLTTADLARLKRAVFLLAISFLFGAVAGLAVATAVPTPFFAGMEAYLCWCGLAAIIQFFFLRLQSTDLANAEDNHAMRSGNSTPVGSGEAIHRLRSRRLCQLRHRVAMGNFFRRPHCDWDNTPQLTCDDAALARRPGRAPRRYRSLSLIRLRFYFFGSFARAVAERVGAELLVPVLILTRIASYASFLSAALIFLFLSTTRDYSAWFGWVCSPSRAF